MNKEQIEDKIKKLLQYQQCNGASRNEEITCFKKAVELALTYNILDVDLDSILRHIFQLERNLDYKKPFQFEDEFLNTDDSFDIVEDDAEWECYQDFNLRNNDFKIRKKYKPDRTPSLLKDIVLGVFLGEISVLLFEKITTHIKGNLAFVCIVLIPGVIAWIVEMVK